MTIWLYLWSSECNAWKAFFIYSYLSAVERVSPNKFNHKSRYLLRTYSTVPRKHRMTIEEHQLFFVRRKEIDRFSRYRYSLFHCRFSQTCTNFLCRCDTKFIFGRKSATPPWRLISTSLNALNGRFFSRNFVMIYTSPLSNL